MDTLQKNQKDRIHLLKIEKDLSDLVKDGERHQNKFEPMSSYHRMLVHRVAAFFGMEHNVDSTGNSVVVNKTPNTRLPDFKFSEYLKENDLCSQEPKKSILKRESSSFDDATKDRKERSPDRRSGGLVSGTLGSGSLSSAKTRRSKSFEEREVQYEKARARIFESAVIKPVVNHESHPCNNSRYKSGRHIPNQMSNLSLNCHSSHIGSTGSENKGRNFSVSNSHAPHGMANCIVNCGSSNGQLSHHPNSIDMNLSNSGCALTPMSADHIRAPKSNVLSMNTVSSASPLCYIHPTLQPGGASSPSLRMSTPTVPGMGANSLQHQNSLESQVTNAIFTDRFNMSPMSLAQTIGLQNTYLNASNVQTAIGSPSQMDMIYQVGTPHQKSNLIFLGSQVPMDNSYQAMTVRSNNMQAIPQLQPMGAPIHSPPAHHPLPQLGQSPRVAKTSRHPSTPNPNLQSLSTSSNTQYPYALNVSLPYNSSQISGGPSFPFPATIQGTPTMPMYVNANGGSVLPGTSTISPHVMPGPRQLAPIPAPTQLPFPYQAPVYRPVPLFFLFNFQNKRGN
ncbi:R3H domain containing protein encore isoform X2 [Brevipalpus obovatus]